MWGKGYPRKGTGPEIDVPGEGGQLLSKTHSIVKLSFVHYTIHLFKVDNSIVFSIFRLRQLPPQSILEHLITQKSHRLH